MFIESVTIDGKEVQLCCCASIMPCFKNVFGIDFLKAASSDPEDISTFIKMGFIMAKMAELNNRGAVSRLTQNDYAEWLDQFSVSGILKSSKDIADILVKESRGTIESKKNSGEQTDR